MRCDCHVHIVGAPDRYSQIASRTYLAGPAPLEDLRRKGAARGITRFVLVQPSFYGSDNRLLLESLGTLGEPGRGVAVIDPDTTPRELLSEYARRRVCGLRVNLYSTPSARSVRRLDQAFGAATQIARELNWHVEVIAPIAVLLDSAEIISRASVPIVIDHYGLYGPARPTSSEGAGLLGLLRLPHVWMKLSAPYRVSDNPLSTCPDPEWLAAILATGSERCVWGSDWPHTPPHESQRGPDTALPYRDLAYSAVVDDFLAALSSAEMATAIMQSNPARLYGFPESAVGQPQNPIGR